MLTSSIDDGKISLVEFWKNFSVLNAVEIISESWGQITEKNLHGIWKNLIPECNTNINLKVRNEEVSKQILDIGHALHFDELDLPDIKECLNSHSEPMNVDTLIQFCDENDYDETAKDFDDEMEFSESEEVPKEPVPPMSESNINKILEMIEMTKQSVALNDPNPERRSLVQGSLESAIKGYRVLLRGIREEASTNQSQSTLDKFFKPVSK